MALNFDQSFLDTKANYHAYEMTLPMVPNLSYGNTRRWLLLLPMAPEKLFRGPDKAAQIERSAANILAKLEVAPNFWLMSKD